METDDVEIDIDLIRVTKAYTWILNLKEREVRVSNATIEILEQGSRDLDACTTPCRASLPECLAIKLELV